MAEKKVILIDLQKPTDVQPFDSESELIQRRARTRLMTLVDDQLKRISAKKGNESGVPDELLRERAHNAITISGSRGSGKTTFILNVLQELRKRALRGESDRLHVFEVFDPTITENKENILITIVAKIQQACRAEYDSKCGGGGAGREDQWKSVEDTLRKTAGGLALFDGVGSGGGYGDNWEDPQYILQRGLKTARSGSEFEKNFRNYVEAALEFIGCSAFVITFDDIDTQFQKGWPVLEVIRKYLTSPRLIVILCGDLRLYSKLIRRHQFENLGETLLRFDRAGREHHGDNDLGRWEDDAMVGLVGQLEEQYLQKILKPESRIRLWTLDQYSAPSSDYQVEVRTKPQPSVAPEINSYIDSLIARALYVTDKGEARVHRESILRQPVRMVVQVLKAGAGVVDHMEESSGDAVQDFTDRLFDVFASALFHFELDPAHISSGDIDDVIGALIAWFRRAEIWETGYRLRPEYRDADKDSVAISFSARLARLFDASPGDVMTYMLKIGLTREFILQRNEAVTADAIVRFLNLEMAGRTSTVSRLGVSVQRAFALSHGTGLKGGSIPVVGVKIDTPNMLRHLYLGDLRSGGKAEKPTAAYNERFSRCVQAFGETVGDVRSYGEPIIHGWWRRAKAHWRHESASAGQRQKWKGVVYNTFSDLFSGLEGKGRYLALAACIVPDRRGQDTTFLSIFNLMACVAEILNCHGRDETDAMLRRLSQWRTYPTAPWAAENSQQGEEEIEVDPEPRTSDTHVEPDPGFVNAMEAWRTSALGLGMKYPASLYSRVTARLYYTLSRMDEELGQDQQYTGNVLHRQIVALFNAALVEERLVRGEPVRLDNATKHDQIFYENFTGYMASGEGVQDAHRIDFSALPFVHLLFSCPLFGFFLQPTVDVYKGNKEEEWSLLDLHFEAWHCHEGEPENFLEARRNVVKVKHGDMEFANFWDPLNSVPMLKTGNIRTPDWAKPVIGESAEGKTRVRRRIVRKRAQEAVSEVADPDSLGEDTAE